MRVSTHQEVADADDARYRHPAGVHEVVDCCDPVGWLQIDAHTDAKHSHRPALLRYFQHRP